MAVEVCHKVWVVVHDLQRMHLMVVCHRVWPISLGGIQVDVVTVAYCHDLFPRLSPIHLPAPYLYWVYSSDLI